jgi:hypothetical protein
MVLFSTASLAAFCLAQLGQKKVKNAFFSSKKSTLSIKNDLKKIL